MVDEDKCTGCMLCEIACALEHTGTTDLERAHIKVYAINDRIFVPLSCNHCETPSCAGACPTTACHRDPADLRVVIDDSRCIGCKTCTVACPFGHAHYDEASRVSAKCDYCDGDPECVRVCEPGALTYVHADESSQQKRRESAVVRALSVRR